MNSITATDEVRWLGARRGMVAWHGIGESAARDGTQRRMAVAARQSGCERTPRWLQPANCLVDADGRLHRSSGCDRGENVTGVLGRREGQLLGLVRRPIKLSVRRPDADPFVTVDLDVDIDYNTNFLQTDCSSDYPPYISRAEFPVPCHTRRRHRISRPGSCT
jgi:hypothetical protein